MNTHTTLDQIVECYGWLREALAEAEEYADAMGRSRMMVRLPAHQFQGVLEELRDIQADNPQLADESPTLANALSALHVVGAEERWACARSGMGGERDRHWPPSVSVSAAALRQLVTALEPLVDRWALGAEPDAPRGQQDESRPGEQEDRDGG